MCRLQVEELEPRRLLNGCGFSARSLPAQPSAAGSFAAPAAERAPSPQARTGCAGPAGQQWAGDARPETGPSRDSAPPSGDGGGAGGPAQPVPAPAGVGSASSPPSAGRTPRADGARAGSDVAGNTDTGPVDTNTTPSLPKVA